ncbi:radical SAM protein [Candidatus Woesearchaeota archaeon]|nr:radical SAM protein [Candidatus Woesearchaeota archaeon]
MVQETKWHSWFTGNLPKGCAQCVQGRKLVLFITGKCGQSCYYCPVSEKKFGHDVVYANEWQITDPDNPTELLEEAKLTEAKGAGITGGDPLMNVNRVCDYIELLKKEFGERFHIHLYTPLQLVTEKNLSRLYEAGLDEIRFHPDIDDEKWWGRMELALKFDWAMGVEIPALPGKDVETMHLIDYISDKLDFINLNELELSDTQVSHYKLNPEEHEPKDELSYGVKGSKDMALRMARYAETKGLSAHFCTAKLKDAIQVGNRMKNRAKNVALPVDKVTEDGLLIRGVLYIEGLEPGFDYQERLINTSVDLEAKRTELIKKNLFKEHEIFIDVPKKRFIVSRRKLKRYAKELKRIWYVPAITEEQPTSQSLELEIDYL